MLPSRCVRCGADEEASPASVDLEPPEESIMLPAAQPLPPEPVPHPEPPLPLPEPLPGPEPQPEPEPEPEPEATMDAAKLIELELAKQTFENVRADAEA